MTMTHPQIDAALTKTDQFISRYPSLFQYDKLQELETKTGYSKVYFFFSIVLAFASIVFLLGGAKLVTDLVSFVYPAYMSFKAIDSGDPEADTQWLTYWVVYGFCSIVESIASFIIGWIPMYFVFKVSFFVWLYHPSFLGAGVVYTNVLRPIVMPYVESVTKKSS